MRGNDNIYAIAVMPISRRPVLYGRPLMGYIRYPTVQADPVNRPA